MQADMTKLDKDLTNDQKNVDRLFANFKRLASGTAVDLAVASLNDDECSAV